MKLSKKPTIKSVTQLADGKKEYVIQWSHNITMNWITSKTKKQVLESLDKPTKRENDIKRTAKKNLNHKFK